MTRRGPSVIQQYFCRTSRSKRHRIVRQFIRSKSLVARRLDTRAAAEAHFRRA